MDGCWRGNARSETIKMPKKRKTHTDWSDGRRDEGVSAGCSRIYKIIFKYDIPDNIFKDNDLQVHIPERCNSKTTVSRRDDVFSSFSTSMLAKGLGEIIAMTGGITLGVSPTGRWNQGKCSQRTGRVRK